MEPITRPVCEPRRDWNYFMDQPGIVVNDEAELPMHEPFSTPGPCQTNRNQSCNLRASCTLVLLVWSGTCSLSTMFRVYTLHISVADSPRSCKLDVSGFVASRDFLDGRRNYIFNREMADPLTVVSQNGILPLPTMSPWRAIRPNNILLEFYLKMKRTGDGIDSYQQLIQGVSEHPSGWPKWSRVNELSILSCGHRSIPMMRLKLAMIRQGVEATVELCPLTLPPQRIDLRCAARTGWIGDDIVLFDGKYGGDDAPLQFVVATELGGSMEI